MKVPFEESGHYLPTQEPPQKKMISIESSDGTSFLVNQVEASISKLVCDAIYIDEDGDDHLSDDTSTSDVTPVQLINVKSECLQNIVEYMKHYAKEPMIDIPVPLKEGSFADIVQQEWYRTFVQGIDSRMLFQLVTAADYMDIQPLLSLTCLRVSSDLMGKSSEQIRDILGIPKLSPEEETKAREEHSWIFADSNGI